MTKPTHQDANIMLQLLQVWAALDISDAVGWVWSGEFIAEYAEFIKKYPAGTEEYRYASKVCMYLESVGTLYKHGLFSEELLFDWVAVDTVWERIKGFPLGLREAVNNPHLYENFEAMANAQKER